MISPGAGATRSPVYTPALFQNEPPPWAHPTPSPSPMIRCPDPDARSRPPGINRPTSPAPPHLAEIMWEVCMPFFHQMIRSLEQSMQQEIQARVEWATRDRSPTRGRGGHTTFSPLVPDRSATMPFHSLLNPSPSMQSGRPLLRRAAPRNDEPLHEEGSDSGNEMDGGMPADGARGGGSAPQALPHKVGFGQQAPGSGSGGDPPRPHGALPEGSSSSKGRSPSQGLEPSWHALLGNDSAGAAANQGASLEPVYLAWSEQQPGANSRSSPSVGRLSPTMGRMSPLSQRLSPGASPLMPATRNLAKPAAGNGGGQQMVISLDQRIESSPSIPTVSVGGEWAGADGGALAPVGVAGVEKSVMVCRHWKSKGWCRMEENCKFLHPEHKRGTSAAPKKAAAGVARAAPKPAEGGGGGGDAQAAAESAAAPGDGSAPQEAAGADEGGRLPGTRATRRGGKSKRSANSSGAAANPPGPPPGVMAPGLVTPAARGPGPERPGTDGGAHEPAPGAR